jgi:8-oxo-dGTP pyrophosphatase MutT (NUDIX family)
MSRERRRKPPVEEAVSAGGVVFRFRNDRAEIVLVARPATNLWALPKGTPEPGESLEETARREVSEETGLHVAIVQPLADIEYSFPKPRGAGRVDKVVHHFLMTPNGGDVTNHDHEYDLVAWYGVDEALRLMTYDNERSVVQRAAGLIDDSGKNGTDG